MLRQSLLQLRNVGKSFMNARVSIHPPNACVVAPDFVRYCSSSAATTDAGPVVRRLSHIISLSGLSSRRQAEEMIKEGLVTVNGERVTAPVAIVEPDAKICVDGQPVKYSRTAAPRPRLWMINKLKGELVTESDERGRTSIMDRIRKMGFAKGKHLKPVVKKSRRCAHCTYCSMRLAYDVGNRVAWI